MPLGIQDFKILKQLTMGSYGKVFLGSKKTDSSKVYAIKMMSKEEIKNKNLIDQVTAERNALAISHCPYIVHLYYSLQTEKNVYLVMEYLSGGDLKTLIIMYESLSLSHASIYAKEIMIALEYLHSHKIIHRDLKPDNILISDDGHLKLTDFGLSKVSLPNKNLQLNEILYTPSKKKFIQNTDYLRTPNQLHSLMDKLKFHNKEMMTPTLCHKRPHQTDFKEKIPRLTKRDDFFDSVDTILPSTIKKSCTDEKIDQESIIQDIILKNFLIEISGNLSTDVSSEDVLGSLNAFVIPESKFVVPIKSSTPLQRKKENIFSSEVDNSLHNLDLTNDGRVLGTPDYLPPEILLNVNYRLQGPPIDWWALGVIIFEMLVGCTPFSGESVDDIFNNITKECINWPEDPLDSISVDAINGLLKQNPAERWGYSKLKDSEFIKCSKDSIGMPFIPNLLENCDTGYHDARNYLFDFNMNHNLIDTTEAFDEF